MGSPSSDLARRADPSRPAGGGLLGQAGGSWGGIPTCVTQGPVSQRHEPIDPWIGHRVENGRRRSCGRPAVVVSLIINLLFSTASSHPPITRGCRPPMRFHRPIRLMQAFVGASLTLLAMSLVAPGSARAASCDHPAERPGIGLDALRPDRAPATRDQAPRPKPCDGPSCSNKSAPAPMSASSPQPPPRSELWGVGVEIPAIDPPIGSSLAPADDLDRPIRFAPPIFHPPRLPG